MLRPITLVASLLAAMTVIACGGDGGDEGANSKEPLVLAALQGPVADGGPDFMQGTRMAEQQINAKGGINGRPVEVRIFKKGLSAQETVQAYRDAASDDDVLAAWVAGGSGLALKSQADRVRLPFLASVGRKELTDPVNPYAFAVSAGEEYATSAVSWAVKNRGTKRIAVLHYDTDFSNGLTPAIRERCKELGCEVVTEQEAAIDDPVDALVPQLTKMKNSAADTYYIESVNPNGPKAARQLGMFDRPVITEQWLTVPAIAEAAGPAAGGMVFGGHKCRNPSEVAKSDPTREWCEQYIEDYEEMFPGEEFKLYSIYGHDAMMLFADAAKRLMDAGEEVNRENISKAFEEFDGSLRTSHGLVKSSPEDHDLIGSWHEAYLDQTVAFPDGKLEYVIAPEADPAGATP